MRCTARNSILKICSHCCQRDLYRTTEPVDLYGNRTRHKLQTRRFHAIMRYFQKLIGRYSHCNVLFFWCWHTILLIYFYLKRGNIQLKNIEGNEICSSIVFSLQWRCGVLWNLEVNTINIYVYIYLITLCFTYTVFFS